MSVFNWVKLAYAFTHFPQPHHSIHNPTNQPFKLSTSPTNQPTAHSQHHTSSLYYFPQYYTTTTPTTLNGSNNTHNNTIHTNNITTPQHTKNPLELKIEPCRTMLYFKAQNRLSASRLYSVDIIINRYRKNRLYKRIEPLQDNKKNIIYKYIIVYDVLIVCPYLLAHSVQQSVSDFKAKMLFNVNSYTPLYAFIPAIVSICHFQTLQLDFIIQF